MTILDRLTIETRRAGAMRLVAAWTVLAAVLSGGGNGLLSFALDTPLISEVARSAGVAMVVTPMLVWPLAKAGVALREREAQFERQAQTDSLTGALNRRGFFAAASRLMEISDGAALVAMAIDLDHFKQINDTFGHAAGDEAAIAANSAITQASAESGGIVGRIGGDEFCVLFPDLSEAGAAALAERLRGAVAKLRIAHLDRTFGVTVSIGYAARRPQDATLDMLLARADAALYAAKAMGRNRASAAFETRPALRRA